MGPQLMAAIKLLSADQAALREILVEVGRETGAYSVLEPDGDESFDVTIGPDLAIDLLPVPEVEWNEDVDEGPMKEAQWLLQSADKRRQHLWRLAAQLASRQAAWLAGRTEAPQSIELAELAEALGVHASTVSRLLQNKRVKHERGEGPLDSLLGKS